MELEVRSILRETAKEFNGLIGFVGLDSYVKEPKFVSVLLREMPGKKASRTELRICEFWDGVRQPRLVFDSAGRAARYWNRVPGFRFPTQEELDEERRLYPKILEAREST